MRLVYETRSNRTGQHLQCTPCDNVDVKQVDQVFMIPLRHTMHLLYHVVGSPMGVSRSIYHELLSVARGCISSNSSTPSQTCSFSFAFFDL